MGGLSVSESNVPMLKFSLVSKFGGRLMAYRRKGREITNLLPKDNTDIGSTYGEKIQKIKKEGSSLRNLIRKYKNFDLF